MGPLYLLASREITLAEGALPISNFVTAEGDWDYDQFKQDLPAHVLTLISGCVSPVDEDGVARVFWDYSTNGSFSISPAYERLGDEDLEDSDRIWDVIWRWEGAQRIRVFLWLAVRHNLLNNAEQKRRHMTDNDTCPRCGNGVETMDHVLRSCKFAKDVWGFLLKSSQRH